MFTWIIWTSFCVLWSSPLGFCLLVIFWAPSKNSKQCSGMIRGSLLRDHSWWGLGNHICARDLNPGVQGKYPSCCTMTHAPIHYALKWGGGLSYSNNFISHKTCTIWIHQYIQHSVLFSSLLLSPLTNDAQIIPICSMPTS